MTTEFWFGVHQPTIAVSTDVSSSGFGAKFGEAGRQEEWSALSPLTLGWKTVGSIAHYPQKFTGYHNFLEVVALSMTLIIQAPLLFYLVINVDYHNFTTGPS